MTAVPEQAGKVVGILEYRGRIIIACEFAVWRVLDDDKLELILEVNHSLSAVPMPEAGR